MPVVTARPGVDHFHSIVYTVSTIDYFDKSENRQDWRFFLLFFVTSISVAYSHEVTLIAKQAKESAIPRFSWQLLRIPS